MFNNRKIILIILLLITASLAAYVLLIYIPTRFAAQSYEGAKQIGKDIREAFQFTPQISVNNTIVIQQQADILELATLSQKFHHTYTWKNTWMGSTKEIEVSGTFDAKAGFDLREKFNIVIEKQKAIVTFPKPKILSVESMGDIQFRDEHGIWNWVHEEDRARAVNAFTKDARRFASQAQFVNDASKNMQEKLIGILKPHVKEAELRIGEQRINIESKE
ncbi:MAG TPA: DUF4230 domain-containing protein [Cyclobacteriaceae bacterium]|nr:DUF4230 domain-containing protein [Cyclobacteriaceae bacterium]